MTLMTAFRIFTVAAVLALVALMLYAGQPEELGWWAAALPLALWVTGPAAAPYLLAARQPRRWFAIALSVYFAISTLLSGLVYIDAFFQPGSSTAALVVVFVPIYQWLALALLLVVCWGSASWLRRRDRAV
jgi:hypothetical protein